MEKKLNIVDELNKLGISVVKKGSKSFCCCPFHSEKTPSCLVDTQKNSFYCFGCGEKGSVYDLVSKKTGVPIFKLMGFEKKLSDELYANNVSKEFFQRNLTTTVTGQKVIDLFQPRGLTKEVIEYFEIGLAPKKSVMYSIFKEMGSQENSHHINKLTYLSATTINKNTNEDFFLNRLMFPIHDLDGNAIGFTGRAISPEENVKYLNTPESDKFKKKNMLFNFYKALNSIKKKKQVYIVEGPFDVLAYHLCGIENVVSPLTCNLSAEQLNLLVKNCGKDIEFVIAFDNDKAGIKGIKNTQELFKSESIWNYKMIRYAFKDAGEYIEAKKINELRKLIPNPLDISEYMASFYVSSKSEDSKSKNRNTFISMVYTFPNFVLEKQCSKYEMLIGEKTNFVLDKVLERQSESNLLKYICYQIKNDSKKRRMFNLYINKELLTKDEINGIENEKYTFRNFENNYKLSNLIVAFLKKRVKNQLAKEGIF